MHCILLKYAIIQYGNSNNKQFSKYKHISMYLCTYTTKVYYKYDKQ